MPSSMPGAPPFVLRARILTPLAAGGTLFLEDGRVEVDERGRIATVSPWPDGADGAGGAGQAGGIAARGIAARGIAAGGPLFDVRPWVVLPGFVDLHTHVPQLPNAGVGDGLDLLTWLGRYTLPLERTWDASVAASRAPLAFAAMAAAGTTTVAAYATVDEGATDAVFRAAEAHGIRAIVGLVLMDRAIGPTSGRAARVEGLAASERLCERWHGAAGGRLRYAFTPRFAVSCTEGMLLESARLAAATGAHWQTHLSEDTREIVEVREAFPNSRDYLDVYECAGALDLGSRALFAHAIHLSEGETARLAESGAGVAHCPASNLFLSSGIMPLARYLAAGIRIGLGSDVSGGPTLSILETMRVGAYADTALRTCGGSDDLARPTPSDWLRLGTLDGARAVGLDAVCGSIEPGKEADLVVVDPSLADPTPGAGAADDAAELVSRLIFRTHPDMVRAAWVGGRRLPASHPGERAGGRRAGLGSPEVGPSDEVGTRGPTGAAGRTGRHFYANSKPGTATRSRRTGA